MHKFEKHASETMNSPCENRPENDICCKYASIFRIHALDCKLVYALVFARTRVRADMRAVRVRTQSQRQTEKKCCANRKNECIIIKNTRLPCVHIYNI